MEMLNISFLEAFWNHLVVKAQTYAQNKPSGGLPLGGQSTKMLQISLLGTSWKYFVAEARKYSKSLFWNPPGTVW